MEVFLSLINLFINLPPNLFYDRSMASSEAIYSYSVIQYVHFQLPVSSRFLKVIQWLLTSSSLSFCPLCLFFNDMFYTVVHTQDVANPMTLSFLLYA